MKILATLALASAAAVAVAQTPDDGDSFLHKSAQGHIAEVKTGELAARKGTSPVVKQFAQEMIDAHSAAHNKVEELAERKDVELPTAPSTEQQQVFDRLQALDGPRFDQEYVAEMVKAHERTVEMLESEIASGRDAETKALAQEMLPTVQSHLREAYRLAGKDEKAAELPKPESR